MDAVIEKKPYSISILHSLVGIIGFFGLVVALALIVYFDDLQLTARNMKEAASIYNIRIAGLKVVDIISILLTGFLGLYILLEGKICFTHYHRNILIIFGIYCWAGIIGFIYSFWYHYDYLDWLQDLQPFIYLLFFFLITFHFTNTKKRWYILVFLFLTVLAVKNYLILYKSVMGEGKSMFYGIIRSSQNSEFSYFPLLFFPLILLLFHKLKLVYRILIFLTIAVYLVNTVMGMVRTVWVILIVGMIILMFHLNKKENFKIIAIVTTLTAIFIIILDSIFPLALDYLWNERFLSILDWKFSGNLSNAIRMVQIVNVWDWVFSNFSFLQGMGLGAWWEESARRMLPNDSSEYHLRVHFRRTDILIVTQLLKIGVIGIILYWMSVFRILKDARHSINLLPYNSIDRKLLLGIFLGLIAAFLSQADFVRLFLIIGVGIGIIASYFSITAKSEKLS